MPDLRNQPGCAPAADPWLTVKQAGEQLGKSRNGILGMIARGELRTQAVAGYTFVLRESVEALATVAA